MAEVTIVDELSGLTSMFLGALSISKGGLKKCSQLNGKFLRRKYI